MSKFHTLRSSVEQRLTEAAQEIFTLFERTIEEYEQELRRSQVENERKQKLLDSILKPRVQLQRQDFWLPSVVKEEVLPEQQEWNPSLDQEDPEISRIKEEQEKEVEEVWSSEEIDAINFQHTNTSVKGQNNKKKLKSSQGIREGTDEDCGGSESASSFYMESYLQPIGNETNDKWTQNSEPESELHLKMKPPACSSATQMETEADEADCGEPEPDLDLNLDPKIDYGPILPSQFSESTCGKIFDDKSSLEKHDDTTIRFSPNTNLTGHSSYLAETKVTTSHNDAKINDGRCKMRQNHFSSSHDEAFTEGVPAHIGEALFICPVCYKHFAQKKYLMKHMANHTEERPFSCPVCKKQFKQSSHVREHMVLHTGEKYVCSVCGKTFSHNSNLHRHIRTHTGEQPFSCGICKKQFSRKSSVQTHMEIHTRMKM